MARKPSTATGAERDKAVEQPKRDSKDNESALNERLDAARGGIESAQSFAKDTVQELKKVQWPTRRQATLETVVVLGTVAILLVTVTVFDWVLTQATNLLFVTP